jgi:ATP-binding cassette subfamily D (ALD) protein 3
MLFLRSVRRSRTKQAGAGLLLLAALIMLRWSQRRGVVPAGHIPGSKQRNVGKGHVDLHFFKSLAGLVAIVVPSWKSWEACNLLLLSGLLVVRTYMSIAISTINGSIVKAIVSRELFLFIKRLAALAMFSLPASTINSGLDYLIQRLAVQFRVRLCDHLNAQYLKGMSYYQMTNLDSRITNPDQRLTQDIERWAKILSTLYSNISKPILDIILFSLKLSELVGWEGPVGIIAWYFVSGVIIKFISPPFGVLTAKEQKLEGVYRNIQSRLVSHSEEVAFYHGSDWEFARIVQSFRALISHIDSMIIKRFFMGTWDSIVVRYGAAICAYSVLGLPVFGPKREYYFAKIGNDPSAITRDYIRNSSLLMNLTKAVGRLVASYKEMQQLAGFTSLVSELKTVIDDLGKGKYERTVVEGCPYNDKTRGKYIIKDYIKFDNVPIVTPNGDVLIQSLNIEILPSMHTFIQGPNGCGKSSLFRILGELWPLFGGVLSKPPIEEIFYIPQRPYLPFGTLREQLIYPHTQEIMKARGVTDADLMVFAQRAFLTDLVENRGGFETLEEWNDTLSGGQKQKIAMCRALYHKPKYAILDECTSMLSMDIEAALYEAYKAQGTTLITVSHRESLLKFHSHLLKFNGEGDWTYSKLILS